MRIIKCVIFFFRYDHPNIIAGQGTLGLEIVEQVPDIDAIDIDATNFYKLKK